MSLTNTEIDLVYLWVDGSDTEWIKKKAQITGNTLAVNEGNCIGRFKDNDELKYSIRSVCKHAQWIRNIYIVTDNQTPDWIDQSNKRVKVINQNDLMPEQSLPCFNSSIIEHYIYKIPGLSERFLYSNDDMFFNADIGPEFFFNSSGYPVVRLQRSTFGKWVNKLKPIFNVRTNIYRKTIMNAALLVEKRFGKFYSGTPHHNIDAYLKSDYADVVEKTFYNEINSTITNTTRHESDIQRIVYLYYLLAINHGTLRYVNRKESCRIRLQKADFMEYITKYTPILFCLNDTEYATDDDRARVFPFLSTLFPEKSEFEK